MYQYQDMNDEEFENLAVEICKEILGLGTQGFSTGKDGGRDGKFVGTANLYPSQSEPWTGTTIIQAKHTSGINKHFLNSDFFSEESESSTLHEEVNKINTLINAEELDNYMLFSNRKLTGGTEPKIKKFISEKTGLNIQKIAVFGINDLDGFLSRYKHIVDMVNLTPLTKFPKILPDELASIIPLFANVFDESNRHKDFTPVERTTFKEKNELNNMSDEFSKSLKRNYMSYVFQVENFLNDPQNFELLNLYQNAIEEFQQTFIIPRQRELTYFDDVFNELVKLLISRDHILAKQKRLTRILVFYMYYNCDIGKSKDD